MVPLNEQKFLILMEFNVLFSFMGNVFLRSYFRQLSHVRKDTVQCSVLEPLLFYLSLLGLWSISNYFLCVLCKSQHFCFVLFSFMDGNRPRSFIKEQHIPPLNGSCAFVANPVTTRLQACFWSPLSALSVYVAILSLGSYRVNSHCPASLDIWQHKHSRFV